MAKKTYTALTTINHDGEPYAAGDPIELDDKTQAPQLLSIGAIEAPAQKSRPAAGTKAE
ncbi:MAG TPA: hypothetical protein PLR37_10660 [Candidatus Accumulibacter phosphatis]|nr:hypothetical protein [Candidatus Accumulibacter phosphatis]